MAVTKVKTKWINGNLIFVDESAHSMRWLDAIGPDVHKYLNDFIEPNIVSSLLGNWTCTAVESGTGSSTVIVQDDVVGGAVRLDAAADEDDGLNCQQDGLSYYMASADRLYFGCRWAISEKTQSDAFVGLAIDDTAILASNPDDMIGFITHDGDANLDYIVRESTNGTATDTGQDLVNDTWVVTEFFYDGSSVYIFVDGSAIATVTSNIPDDVFLKPTLAYLNGAGSQQHDGIEVDWIRAIQIDG
jgi:hypothetical protein